MHASINTAIFLTSIQNGNTQSDCLCTLVNQPIDNIEVRGELFDTTTKDQELKAIGQLCHDNHWGLYYSIPEELFSNGQINENLAEYLYMADHYNINGLKISLGDGTDIKSITLKRLSKQLQTSKVKLTVENQPNSNSEMPAFTEAVHRLLTLVPELGYTFDSGNWYWINQRPETAFDSLEDVTSVFHLKDIEHQETVMLDHGETEWRPMLNKLDRNVPVFLEYEIDSNKINNQIELVNDALSQR
ncbi:sugar phosphate isomerase/epimerase family protein [Secundilactobacillus collinoides]|nr:TIM barrel protein [Secundilactobacillus collinoides]KZL35870.1 hypothetical protein TY91_14770 [Secundilactobacillus collinoides]